MTKPRTVQSTPIPPEVLKYYMKIRRARPAWTHVMSRTSYGVEHAWFSPEVNGARVTWRSSSSSLIVNDRYGRRLTMETLLGPSFHIEDVLRVLKIARIFPPLWYPEEGS